MNAYYYYYYWYYLYYYHYCIQMLTACGLILEIGGIAPQHVGVELQTEQEQQQHQLSVMVPHVMEKKPRRKHVPKTHVQVVNQISLTIIYIFYGQQGNVSCDNFSFCLECFNITVTTTTKRYGGENSWSLGHCYGGGYGSNMEYNEQCCLPSVEYTLTCRDNYGDGWHGGFIEILSQRYCEDFVTGAEANHTINISGKVLIRS